MSSTVAGKCSDSLIMIYSAAAAASEMLILTLLICNSCSSFDTDNSIISIRLGLAAARWRFLQHAAFGIQKNEQHGELWFL